MLFPRDSRAEGKIRDRVETKLILSRGAGCFQGMPLKSEID